MGALAELYLSVRGAAPQPDERARELEHELERLVAAGRAAWPDLALDDAAVVRHVAARCEPWPAPAPHAADVYLACGCALGLAAAHAGLELRYLAKVPTYVARVTRRADVADEVRQALGERLLVPRGDEPGRIVDYRGRGSLESWLRSAAVRLALNAERGDRRRRRATGAAADEALPVDADPELAYLRRRYRPALEGALREAMAALEPRDRVLLRLHHLERVGVHRIAISYGVHRATVSRWLVAAYRALLDEVRRLLRERLPLSAPECDSLIRALQSGLDVALSGLRSPVP